MARRRRLDAPPPALIAEIREAALSAPARPGVFDRVGAPPIARIAADAVDAQGREIAALRADAERYAVAEAAGLIIREIALDAIDVDYLARDRLPRIEEDEGWRVLKASIVAHGQLTPIDVTPLGGGDAGRYGLISGYRRYGVLRRLADETGDARWRKARAVIRTPRTLGAAFVAMVEENEIREALSYYERGQVCVRAVEQGAFPTVDAALEAMFAGASAAKLSKIRSFVRIAEEIGDVLRHPHALGERLGLRAAQALRKGNAGALRRLLGERLPPTRTEREEQNALASFLAGLTPRRAAVAASARSLVGGGSVGATQRGARVEFVIEGRRLHPGQVEDVLAAIAAALDKGRLCDFRSSAAPR